MHLVTHTKLMELFLIMFLIVQHVESDSHLTFPNDLSAFLTGVLFLAEPFLISQGRQHVERSMCLEMFSNAGGLVLKQVPTLQLVRIR